MISTSLVGGSRRRETEVVTLELEPETSWEPLLRPLGGASCKEVRKGLKGGAGLGGSEAAAAGIRRQQSTAGRRPFASAFTGICSPRRALWPPRAARLTHRSQGEGLRGLKAPQVVPR